MSDAPAAFRKLPGRGLTWAGRARLWLTNDYLLEATSALVFERYRRFFFRDIRAVFIRRTKVRLGWGIAQGSIGTLCALLGGAAAWGGAVYGPEAAHIAYYILGGMFGLAALFFMLLLAINVLLGPSCACHILTASGWQELAAPTRLGPAQRVVAELMPLLEAAQIQAAQPAEAR